MAELQVQYIDPQELKPFADNPRHHSERNIQDIQRSIKKFGFTNPILVRQEDNMVVAGHGRLQSAQELGLDEVPVIYLDFSENDAKLYAITDNRTAETSEWDLVALDELVQSLEMDEDELPDTGFYADELEEILAEVQEDVDLYADKDADAVPEEVEPISQAGDLWRLGAHRVLCGDSTKTKNVDQLFGGDLAELMVTDPPYGVAYHSNKKGKKAAAIEGDLTQAAIPLSFAVAVDTVLDSDARLYLFGGTANWPMYSALFDHHLRMQPRPMIWVKESFVLHPTHYHSQYETVFFGWKGSGGGADCWFGDRTRSDVWEISRDNISDRVHPTQKPVGVVSIPIENSSQSGGLVFDPFLGSGSTLIACEKTARQCYGLEIDPHYCDVIVRRYADFVESTQDIILVRDGQELSYESVS